MTCFLFCRDSQKEDPAAAKPKDPYEQKAEQIVDAALGNRVFDALDLLKQNNACELQKIGKYVYDVSAWQVAPSIELIDDEHARFTLVRRRQGDSYPQVSFITGVCHHGHEVRPTAKQGE